MKLEVLIFSLTPNFHIQYPKLTIVQEFFLRNGNVLGTLLFPVGCHEVEPYSGGHAVVIIGIEHTTIPIAGGQMSTTEYVIKNSLNAEQIIRIPEVYNTDDFYRDPMAFRVMFTDLTDDDYLISPAAWNLQLKTI